ncbi:MAG: DUF1634 domain-containing protein [Candidatus Absconditabacterales bacterium]
MKKNIHRLLHIRNTLIILVSIGSFLLLFIHFSSQIYAEDLLENAFYPSKAYETVIDLGNTTNAVGNEFFREGVGVQDSLGQGCFVDNGQTKISGQELKKMICEIKYLGTRDSQIGGNDCTLPGGSKKTISNNEKQPFCEGAFLKGDWDVGVITTQAPLIVRIAKWLLRITIVLSITMVIYNGIMYIVESASGAEKKDTTKNIGYIVGGVLLALMSLGIINLITSLTVSSL